MKKIFSILALLCITCFAAIKSAAQQISSDSLLTTEVKVFKLSCDGDMPTIKKQLLNQDGVMDVNFTTRTNGGSTFTVQYIAGVTDRKGIIRSIESTPGCDDKSSTPYRVKKEKE